MSILEWAIEIYLLGCMFGLLTWVVGVVITKEEPLKKVLLICLKILLSWYSIPSMYRWIRDSEKYSKKDFFYSFIGAILLLALSAAMMYIDHGYLDNQLVTIKGTLYLGAIIIVSAILLVAILNIVRILINIKRG